MCSGHEGGLSLHCCVKLDSPCIVNPVFFKKLLSPVFKSNSMKAVQKMLFVFFNQCEPLTRGADSAVLARY